jgi:hypothetical protein
MHTTRKKIARRSMNLSSACTYIVLFLYFHDVPFAIERESEKERICTRRKRAFQNVVDLHGKI